MTIFQGLQSLQLPCEQQSKHLKPKHKLGPIPTTNSPKLKGGKNNSTRDNPFALTVNS